MDSRLRGNEGLARGGLGPSGHNRIGASPGGAPSVPLEACLARSRSGTGPQAIALPPA